MTSRDRIVLSRTATTIETAVVTSINEVAYFAAHIQSRKKANALAVTAAIEKPMPTNETVYLSIQSSLVTNVKPA
jgi:hypothetical protein